MPKGQPNKRYTPEFKIKVVETMHNERLSYKETARQFDVSYDTVVANRANFIGSGFVHGIKWFYCAHFGQIHTLHK